MPAHSHLDYCSCASCQLASRCAICDASQKVMASQALMTSHVWSQTTPHLSSTSRPTFPTCTSMETLSTHLKVGAQLPSLAHHLHAMPCNCQCGSQASFPPLPCMVTLFGGLRSEELVGLPACALCGSNEHMCLQQTDACTVQEAHETPACCCLICPRPLSRSHSHMSVLTSLYCATQA